MANSRTHIFLLFPTAIVIRHTGPKRIGRALHRFHYVDVAPPLVVIAPEKWTAMAGLQQAQACLAMHALGVSIAKLSQAHLEMRGDPRLVVARHHNGAGTPATIGASFHALELPLFHLVHVKRFARSRNNPGLIPPV